MSQDIEQRMRYFSIWRPLVLQYIFRSLQLSADVFMLALFSDAAVAAVGAGAQVVFLIFTVYLMIGCGASILITQYLGAKHAHAVENSVFAAIHFSIITGFMIGIVFYFFTDMMVVGFDFESDEIKQSVYDYLLLLGSFSIILSLNEIFTALLRSFGYVSAATRINFLGFSLNILGNYVFIFGALGFPVLGVKGVALSTLAATALSAVSMGIFFFYKTRTEISVKRFFSVPLLHYVNIAKVGLPASAEMISSGISQLVIIFLVTQLGDDALVAMTLAFNILRYLMVFSVASGQTTQLLMGYWFGAQRYNDIRTEMIKHIRYSCLLILVLTSLLIVFRESIVGVFSDNKMVNDYLYEILVCFIFLQLARNFNFVISGGLRATGDVLFPSLVGIGMMWGLGVVGAYYFGWVLGFGLIGVWIAMSLDEIARGIFLFIRWQQKPKERYV